MDNYLVSGDRIGLANLYPDQVTDNYVCWMNDLDVTRFLYSNGMDIVGNTVVYKGYTYYDIYSWVTKQNNLYGIYELSNDAHIGNIKLNVNAYHNRADVGFIIGDKTRWGVGLGTEAVSLVVFNIGRDILKLRKISGGAVIDNIGSNRIFEKLGFRKIGIRTEEFRSGDEYKDMVEWEILFGERNER